MLATGEALERYAEGRAHRELTALLSRAPRDVHRYEDGELVTRPIDAVVIGDRLMVKPGEVVPVDGLVEGAAAVLDEAALTGEARPVTRAEGDQVSSGTLNAGALRSPRDRRRRAVDVRRHRPACPGGRGLEGALRAARGPVRAPVRPAHARRCGPRLAGLGGSRPGAGRGRGGARR